MQVIGLKTNGFENPIGYSLQNLSFSWQVANAKGKTTRQTRVLVCSDSEMQDTVYDSGSVRDANSLDFLPNLKTQFATRYYWTVTVWDDADDSATSEVAFFETAKEGLEGELIKAPFDEHPIFTREFELTEEVENARYYLTGLGVYELRINGKRVGKEYLTPYYNDYNLWVQYQTFDVAEYLTVGINRLEVWLGNGWYKGRFGFVDELDCLYGSEMLFIGDLDIVTVSGACVGIYSDAGWRCKKSPVIESSIYDGEFYDSRLETVDTLEDVVVVGEEERSHLIKRLEPRRSLPVVKKQTISPVEIIHTPAGETVLDFGQIMTGRVEFFCEEKRDTEVKLQYGEILQNDNFYNENLRTAKQAYRYISNGQSGWVTPLFTFYGFRFVKVEGIVEVNKDNFKGVVLYSDMETTGHIETSNSSVNRLFLNAMWGQKGNFLDVPTDCPQRDERMGWTGDAQAFCSTAGYNMYTPSFFDKFLYDMRLEQKTLSGAVPHVVPDILGQVNSLLGNKQGGDVVLNSPNASCAWADAATIIPWTNYTRFGSKSMLERQYENMKMWIDYIKNIDDTKCGGKRLWTHGFHFADWLALDNYHAGSSFGGTDCYYVASAFYYYSATLTAKAAKVLGKTEDADFYLELSEQIKAAMQEEYFTITGRIAVPTQTAMVLALHFEIVKEEYKDRLIKDLKAKLDEENIHLTTGFVGTSYLCPTLSKNGLGDYAYTLLLNEDYPSWLYEVNMGATTIWERWNSVLPDGMISDTGMNSLNHYTYGAIAEWMYRYMCGLQSVEESPGFKEFVIAPKIDKRFEWVKMEYKSVFGMIKSGWSIDADKTVYSISVPFDTTAKFILEQGGDNITLNGKSCAELVKNNEIALDKGDYIIEVLQ